MVVKHQSKGHRQEVFITATMGLTASAAGTLIEKKEVRHFELIHILLRFIPLVYQEVTLEVEVALLEKKNYIYIYTAHELNFTSLQTSSYDDGPD